MWAGPASFQPAPFAQRERLHRASQERAGGIHLPAHNNYLEAISYLLSIDRALRPRALLVAHHVAWVWRCANPAWGVPRQFHIVHFLVDDLGFGDVGWRSGAPESGSGGDGVATPTIDALRAGGVTLRHFYTPKDCAPSRCERPPPRPGVPCRRGERSHLGTKRQRWERQ